MPCLWYHNLAQYIGSKSLYCDVHRIVILTALLCSCWSVHKSGCVFVDAYQLTAQFLCYITWRKITIGHHKARHRAQNNNKKVLNIKKTE